jgi:hypothetical protein
MTDNTHGAHYNALLASCLPIVRMAARTYTDRDVVVICDLETELGRLVAFRLQPSSSPDARHLGPLCFTAPMAAAFDAVLEYSGDLTPMLVIVGHGAGPRVVIASHEARAFALGAYR